jgi:hypothetical protein
MPPHTPTPTPPTQQLRPTPTSPLLMGAAWLPPARPLTLPCSLQESETQCIDRLLHLRYGGAEKRHS